MSNLENGAGEGEVFVRGSAIIRLHQELAAETEAAARALQERLKADPSLEHDPEFQREATTVYASHLMLERVMEGVSDATIGEDLTRFLGSLTDGPTEE